MNIISYILILLFSLLTSEIFSQKNSKEQLSKFKYQHLVYLFGDLSISRTEDLFYDGKASLFVVHAKDLNNSSSEKVIENTGGGTVTLTMEKFDDSKDVVLYKNYNKGTMILTDFFESGERCIVNDSIPKLKWKFEGETKKIGPYKCQKASTSFRCANYIVWFTTEIPLQIGPWKLGGLPGLIVEAVDQRKDVTYKYSLLSAEYPSSDKNVNITPPKTKEKIYTFREYAKTQIRLIEKQRLFEIGSSDDPRDSGYFSSRPECYEISK